MRIILALVFLAAAALPQESDVAALFPADTFVYLEADAGAIVEGVGQLDVLKIVGDPKYREFFRPGLERLGLDADNPVGALLARLPVQELLKGRIAVGVRGVRLRVWDDKGKELRVEMAPGKPIDADALHRLAGLYARSRITGERYDSSFDADVLVVAEPGPRLQAMARQLFGMARSETVQLGDRQVTRFDFSKVDDWTVRMFPPLYADLAGERWMLSTSRETLAAALAGGPRASLASSERFGAVRARMAGGNRALFGYVDAVEAVRMLQSLVPPIARQEADRSGLVSVVGLGFGVSLNEGGVRESFGLVLDGDPKGVWRILDAFPGGLRSVEIAPPDAMAVFGLKFDAALLMARLEETAALLLPGTEDLLRPFAARAVAQAGLDLEKEVLGALGDEIGLILFPPQGLIIPAPAWVFGLEIRDEDAFNGVLAKLRRIIAAENAQVRLMDIALEGDIKGIQVLAPLPMTPPLFVVHKGHFFGASDKELLLKALKEWGKEGAPSLAKDGPVFTKVLKGLNGGERDNLVALGYLDLRALVASLVPYVATQLPAEWFDLQHMPDPAQLASGLKGAAFGIRRDGHGVTLDIFSPVGAVLPAVGMGLRQRAAYDPARDIEELKLEIESKDPDAPFWGIQSLSSRGEGVNLIGVFDGTPAAAAGLRAGDVVTRIGDAEVKDLLDLRRATLAHKAGATVPITIVRDGEEMVIQLTLGRRGDCTRE